MFSNKWRSITNKDVKKCSYIEVIMLLLKIALQRPESTDRSKHWLHKTSQLIIFLILKPSSGYCVEKAQKNN